MAQDFGVRIKLEGESEFKSAVSKIGTQMKELNSEMQVVSTQFDKNNKSVEANAARYEVLSKQVDLQREKVALINDMLAKATYAKSSDDILKYSTQLNNATAQLNKLNDKLGENSALADEYNAELAKNDDSTQKFKSSLADVESNFKVLNTEMQAVNNEYKNNSTSADAVSARAEVLNKQLDTQNSKLKLLREELERSAKAYGDDDEKTKDLARQTEQAAAEFNKLETEIEQNNSALDKAGEKSEESGSKFEKLGGVLKGVGVAVGTVAVAAGAAAVKIGSEVVKSFGELEQNLGGSEAVFGDYAKSIQESGEEAYKNLGVSQSDYLAQANKMGALFQGSGIEQAKSLELTEKAMQRAADVASVMGVDTEFALESISGAAKGNYAMMDNLGVAMSETSIKAYAAEKGLISLTDAEKAFADLDIDIAEFGGGSVSLDEMKIQYDELVNQALNGTGAVREQALNALDSVGVSFLDMQQKDPSKLFDKFVDGAERAAEKVGDTKLNLSIDEKTELAMEMFFEKTEQYAGNFTKESEKSISGSLGMLQASLGSFTAGLGNSEADMTNLTQNLVTSFEAVVANIVPVLENIVTSLPAAFETILTAVGDLLPMLLETATGLFAQILSMLLSLLPELIPVAVGAVMMIIDTLIENLPLIIDGALTLVMSLADGILKALPALANAAVEIVVKLAAGIGDALPELIPAAISAIMQIVQGLLDNLPLIIDAAIKLIIGLAEGLIKAVPVIIEALPKIITSLISGLLGAIPQLIEAGITLFVSLIQNLPTIIVEIVKAIPQIIVALVKGLAGGIGKIAEVGGNIVRGLWDGIVKLGTWIQDKVSGFFSGIVDGVKGLLGIHSPSTVFAEIGENTGKGYANGLSSTAKTVLNVAEKMTDALSDEYTRLNSELESIEKAEELRQKKEKEQEYFSELNDLKSQLNSLGATEFDAREKIKVKIYNLEKKYNDELRKTNETAYKDELKSRISAIKEQQTLEENAYKESIKNKLQLVEDFKTENQKIIDDINSDYQKSYDDIKNQQSNFSAKLSGYGELFEREKTELGENFTVRDLTKDIQNIQAFGNSLDSLKNRGVSEDLLAEIQNMGVDDGILFAENLLNRNDSDFQNYLNQWELKQKTAQDIAKKYYKDDFQTLDDALSEQLSEAKIGMVSEGENLMKSLADGIKNGDSEIENAFNDALKNLVGGSTFSAFSALKNDALNFKNFFSNLKNSASPSAANSANSSVIVNFTNNDFTDEAKAEKIMQIIQQKISQTNLAKGVRA